MGIIQNPPQEITIETYEAIMKDDNIHNGLRRVMSLFGVIKSYPYLYNGIKNIVTETQEENRQRYYPYIASVLAGKEKYKADDFFFGFGGNELAHDNFKKLQSDLKNHIIDNEHLHEFWML